MQRERERERQKVGEKGQRESKFQMQAIESISPLFLNASYSPPFPDEILKYGNITFVTD
jgi:hypothetical protein